MNYDSFYKICQELPSKDQQWAKAFIHSIDKIFEKDDPKFDNLSDVCKLFYGDGKGLSKAQYYRKKKLVRIFYEWLYSRGHITKEILDSVCALKIEDVVSEDELNIYYFRGLDAALNYVSLVGSANGQNDETCLLNIKTIVILAWHGIEAKQMLLIKKEDLDSQRNQLFIRGEEDTLKLTLRECEILYRFASVDLHRGFPSPKAQLYRSSDYLLRSSRSPVLTQNNLYCMIKRFSDVSKDYGKCLNLVALKKNGIFNLVYEQEKSGKPVGALIQDLAGCDCSFAFGYKKFYEMWKRHFISAIPQEEG